jgi:hypothetical protein
MSKLLADIGKLRPAELTPLQTAVLGLHHPEYPELAEAAALELEHLQAIEKAVRERAKDALGIFDGGHGKRYAYCNDCHAIGETLDQGSIKHHRGCLVDALGEAARVTDEGGG